MNRIADTHEDDRWPSFAAEAAAHGIRSTISYPMEAGEQVTGALNLYSPDVDGFADTDEELGLALARQAAVLLANKSVQWDALQLAENMQDAMRSRATIEQAKGLVMATRRCTPDEAFSILVRASQRQNRKLRDIATEMVERFQAADAGGA